MKKILFGLFLSLSLTTFVFAQEAFENFTGTENLSTEYVSGVEPDLYIDQISVDKGELKTGGFVKGKFNLYNTGERTAADVRYRIDFVTVDSSDGFIYPLNLIDSSEIAEIGLVESGLVEKSFSYKIPSSLPSNENFAISIVAMIGNHDRTRENFAINNISGNFFDYLEQDNTNLSIGDETFLLREGPTISKNEKLKLETTLTSKQELSDIVPNLVVYSGINQSGEVVYDVELNKFNLLANTPTQKIFELPTEFKEGVYTAILSLTKDEQIISEVVEMRYIIGGENLLPKIGDVHFNNVDQNLIDKFIVSVSFLNAPINHRLDENGDFVDPRAGAFYVKDINSLSEDSLAAKVFEENINLTNNFYAEVSILDAKTNKIIETKKVNNLSNITDIEFNKIKKYSEIKIAVSLKDGEKNVDTKEINLNIIPITGKYLFLSTLLKDPRFSSTVGFILLVLILSFIGIFAYVNKHKKIASLSIVLVGLSVAGSLLVLNNPNKAIAGELMVNYVNVSNPKPPSVRTYMAGEAVQFSAEVNFSYCGNSWHNRTGQISAPVPYGSAHGEYGAVINSSEQTVNRRDYDEVIRIAGRTAARTRGSLYNSSYNTTFTAPKASGTYWFKYLIVLSNGQGTGKTVEGVSTFKVIGPDICKNIPGHQDIVPAGYIRTGVTTCGVVTKGSIQCSVSKGNIDVGDEVTFTARNITGNKSNFTWFKGRNTSPVSRVKNENDVTTSSYTAKFDFPGIYYATAEAITEGESKVCDAVVSVGNFQYEDTDEEYVFDEGIKYLLDVNAAAGKVNLDIDGGITNKTCKISWSAQNVLKCKLYKNTVKVKDLPFSGSEDLTPGIYQVRCLQSKDGSEIFSETRTCRLNPDVREI